MYQRAKPVLDEIIQNHLGQEVVVVSHGGLMKAIIAMLVGADVRDVHIPNVGCLTLAGDGSTLSIQSYLRIKL